MPSSGGAALCIDPKGKYLLPGSTSDTVRVATGQHVWKAYGRLDGEQNNSYAEAMALLQVLRWVQPSCHLQVYIDNLGVIQRWQGLRGDDPHSRAKWGCRAVWNRIHALMDCRERAGGSTELEWIHSHVDDEDRRQRKKQPTSAGMDWWEVTPERKEAAMPTQPLPCACGGDHEGHCVAAHPHHLGNVLADCLADQGKALEQGEHHVEVFDGGITVLRSGYSKQLECRQGEDRYVLRSIQSICQGNIAAELATRSQDKRLGLMAGGKSQRAVGWTAAYDAAWKVARAGAMAAGTSQRFKVRAWADCLPTYQNMARRARGDGPNLYQIVYGDGGEFQGHCLRCREGVVESMNHAFCECPAGTAHRQHIQDYIHGKWEEAGMGEVWTQVNWLAVEYEGWEPWWGWVGLVPMEAVYEVKNSISSGAFQKAQALVSATARMLTKYATVRPPAQGMAHV